MEFNWYILFVSALIPLITGFVWYNPKVMGGAWMSSTGLTEEQLKGANMMVIFGLTYLCGLFISSALMSIVIHQMGFFSVFQGDTTVSDPNSPAAKMIADFTKNYATNFRTFKHGALHGTMTGFFMAMPITAIMGMFERKGVKYVAVHTGYWMITLGLMGGLICAFL